MSTFRPPQVPIQPSVFFTPGAPSVVPLKAPDQRAAYFRSSQDLAAVDEVLPPFFPQAPLPSVYRPPANVVVQFRAREFDFAAIEEALPFATFGFPAGKPPALPLNLPQAAARQDLAALEEALPAFAIPVTPASFVAPVILQMPFAPQARNDALLIEETLPFYVPPAQQIPAVALATPTTSSRADLAALEEVLPPFYMAPAQQIPSIKLQIPYAAMQSPAQQARLGVAALLSPSFVPPALAASMQLYARDCDRTAYRLFAWVPIAGPVITPIDAEQLLEAAYESRVLVAPYDPRLMIVTYNGRH